MAKGDMFLKVESAISGAIKGESKDTTHTDEIDILGWSWGMEQPSSMGAGGAATGRRTLDALTIIKHVDKASTALMSCLSRNETIKKAVLTVRKAAGATPFDYLHITIEKGRVASLHVETDPNDNQKVIERLTLTFQKIEVEYAVQNEAGGTMGRNTFTDSIDRS